MKNKKTLATLAIVSILSTCAWALPAYAANNGQARDGEIIAYVIAIDSHEVDAAKVALEKSPRNDVANYAHEMINDHGKNLDQMKSLSASENIPLRETKSVDNFITHGNKAIQSLDKATPTTIDTKYIDAMVTGHEEALSKLKGFVKTASNHSLKQLLKTTEETVSSHLTKAKELQNQ